MLAPFENVYMSWHLMHAASVWYFFKENGEVMFTALIKHMAKKYW